MLPDFAQNAWKYKENDVIGAVRKFALIYSYVNTSICLRHVNVPRRQKYCYYRRLRKKYGLLRKNVCKLKLCSIVKVSYLLLRER